MGDRRLGMALAWVRRRASVEDHAVADAELLERFVRRNDEAAFELLAWRHQRLIYGVCLRVLNDVHDAEDAFQAAFLVFARKARSIGHGERLAVWLYKVAYRCALTVRSTRGRRRDRGHPHRYRFAGGTDQRHLLWQSGT